jgi:hypothetical protein
MFQHGNRKCTRDKNIKMELGETVWKGVEWIHLAMHRDQWQVVVNMATNRDLDQLSVLSASQGAENLSVNGAPPIIKTHQAKLRRLQWNILKGSNMYYMNITLHRVHSLRSVLHDYPKGSSFWSILYTTVKLTQVLLAFMLMCDFSQLSKCRVFKKYLI